MTLYCAGAMNHKMALTNIVQDAILYLKMNYQHILQKFPYLIMFNITNDENTYIKEYLWQLEILTKKKYLSSIKCATVTELICDN